MKNDRDLRNDVIAQLEWDPQVTTTHMGVSASDGIVTLTGQVPSALQKHRAERAAKRVMGVRAVANELEVQLPGKSRRTDADIAAACLAALKEHVAVPNERIQVVVRGGAVTLDGEVEWNFQKIEAERAIHPIAAVVSVTNNITISPKAPANDIQTGIELAFRRHAEIDAGRVKVEAIGGQVVLRGTVRSWAERDEAQDAAWAAPGVVSVDNRLVVEP